MKNSENIERWEAMTPEELLSQAEASGAEVPRELSARLDSQFRRLTDAKRALVAVIGLAAASVALALVIGAPSAQQPKDTFSSPEEAYAVLESTLAHIAGKAGAATLALDGSMQRAEDTITEIYR